MLYAVNWGAESKSELTRRPTFLVKKLSSKNRKLCTILSTGMKNQKLKILLYRSKVEVLATSRNFCMVESDRWNLVCHGGEVGAKKIVFYRVSGTKCVESRFFRSDGCPNDLK